MSRLLTYIIVASRRILLALSRRSAEPMLHRRFLVRLLDQARALLLDQQLLLKLARRLLTHLILLGGSSCVATALLFGRHHTDPVIHGEGRLHSPLMQLSGG